MMGINCKKLGISLLVIGASLVVLPILKGLFWLNIWVGVVVTGLLLGLIGLVIIDNQEGDNE